jgi:hypothetical protein
MFKISFSTSCYCWYGKQMSFFFYDYIYFKGLPNNACYVLHCVVSTIEQGWIMDNSRKLFTKHNRLHYLDVMAINFILQLYMNDMIHCPSITYKHILRYLFKYKIYYYG